MKSHQQSWSVVLWPFIALRNGVVPSFLASGPSCRPGVYARRPGRPGHGQSRLAIHRKATRREMPGEAVLCAYAHFKAEHDASNPVVQTRGIEEAIKFSAGDLRRRFPHKANYEAAVSVMLLSDLKCDPNPLSATSWPTFQRYYQEVQFPARGLRLSQRDRG